MPRTKEDVNETFTGKTFQTYQAPQTDYHLLLLTIGPAALADGTVTGDMADGLVRTWIESGYDIHTIHYVGTNKDAGGQGTFKGFQVMYHFVKRVVPIEG